MLQCFPGVLKLDFKVDFSQKDTDNNSMAESSEFLTQFKEAVKAKNDYLNSVQLPKMLDHYRLLHTCVKNLYELLVKRSLITPDPYKLEIKISDIACPEESPYIEGERSVVIGSRFSNYESMLDFVCTYIKFSTEFITIPRVKKLLDLNNAFQWNNMTQNNSRTNSRGLATLIQEARHSASQMQLSLINDSITKSAQSVEAINVILKELMTFQRESYKLQIRHDVFEHPKYDKNKALNSQADEIAEIKSVFGVVMGKAPFYSELIQEIAAEDLAPNRQKLQEQTLENLKIVQQVTAKKTVTVDYKKNLLDCLHTLSGLGEVYALINDKLNTNINILEKQKNTLFNKIKKAFRIAFNIPEPPLMYDLIIVDPKKDTKQHRNVDMNVFMTSISRKAAFFTPLANKNSAEFNKVKSYPEDKILEFLNKNISENQEILVLLDSSDEYFKQKVSDHDRTKIKGLKMDLMSVKNIIIKAIQQRSEYVNHIEEEEQMKKLGIKDEF